MGSYAAHMANQKDQWQQAYQRLSEKCLDLANTIDLLKTLLDGCPIHPTYKAEHKPSCDCKKCESLYTIHQHLKAKGVLQ